MATYNINLNLSTAAAQAQLSALQTAAGRPITAKVNFSQPLGRITGDLAMFDKSMAAASARVAAFGVTSGAIYLVSKAMSEAAKSMMLVDKELTELNTFLGQSQGQLKSFGDSLFSIAKNTATSFSAVAEAAKEFARQGLSMEDTLKRTNDALILSRISGLGAAESVTALTTAINSFNKSGLSSAEIINKLVQVDSQFAVSSSDLAQALSRVGSSAQDSGVSIDQLVASVTAAQQTTGRGGAVIGNALKTIFTRMKRPEVIDQLREIGVAVRDQNGYFLDGISILKNYTDATKNLSQTEKAKTAELLGGIYQINVLNSLINDLSRSNGVYARALQASNSATDEAFDKNEALNQSLTATIEITKANLQQKGAAIATPLLTPLVKTGTAIINKTLNVFDKKEGDEEGAKSGRSFGESLLKGLGAAIAGPGLVIVGALAFSIGKKLLTFGTEAVKSLLGVTSASQNILNLQSLIASTLNNQPQIIQQIVSGQISQTTAAQALLTIMQQQAAQLQTNATLSSTLANTLAQGGFTVSPTTGLKKRRAMGYIPKADQDAERAGALSGGYSPGMVVKTPSSIGGIMNTSEKVKYVSGFSQPFINPPKNSKAGRMHQENSIKQTGINPYSSRGFIPNFVPVSHKASYYKGNQLIEKKADHHINKFDDSFSADIQPVLMKQTIGEYRKQARDIMQGIWGSPKKLKEFEAMFKGKVGDDSYARTLSSLQNMKGLRGGYMNARNQVQGLIGEAEVIKTTKGAATGENSPFDVILKNQPKGTSNLAEVRTRQVVNKEDILLKAIRQRLQSVDYQNNETQNISLGTYKTYLPSNAKFKSLGFIPNFAYLDNVKNLEKEAGNGTAIFDNEPFPHVRNSSQPTFESAINDHGGLQNALSDSASMQKGAGLIKSKGFIPNFSKISDWWEQKRKDERLADMAAFRAKHGNMSNYQPQEGPSMMSGMIRSSLIGGASMMLSGAANQNNVGMIANVQRGVPLAMAGIDIAKGFARGRTGWGKAANVGMAIAQNAPAIISGLSGASQTEADVRSDQFQKVKDNTADKFNKLTQNAGQLAQSIEDLNNAYLDPSVSPETLIKLGKKQAELMRSMDKSNPQAAMKFATARTSAEKQTILTDAVESATKDKVVNDASIKFLELDDKKRKPKAIKSLFSDWSSQADMSKLDVKNLTPENLGEALKKAGIGDANKVLAGTKGRLITPFINFLQTNEKISEKEELTKNQLTNLRRPSSDIRMQNEQNKKLRAIKKSSRGDYLNDLVDYASNFGPESEMDARRNVDVAMESGQERARFGAMLSSKAEKMPGLSRFIGQGPSQELESSLKNSIKQTKDPKQKNELEALLSETKQSQNAMQVIESKADEKKKKDLALLALKQRLVFGGGMAASLSYEGKRASDEPTARASMQYALGNRFGSRNTADAGYVNFAKGVKEKYAGLNFGEGAFDRATEVGANLRARDLRKSLLRDARRADRMGDYQLGGAMRAKANDSQDLYAIGKTQTQAHLGLSKMPDEVKQAIGDYSQSNTQDDMQKRSDDQRLRASEKAMQPQADALINESSKDTKAKMDEFETSLGASFERGLTIKRAQIIVQGLDPDSEKKKEGSFMDGVMSYFSNMASDVSDYFTGYEGPDASSADQAAAAGMGKASGFIPNFKSPLRDAIRRESEFVPFDSIRVNQSNKLKQSSNPFGLAVTNTIDEPRGLASIGLAGGYIPNFANKVVQQANETNKLLSKSQSKALDKKFYNDKTPRAVNQRGIVAYNGKEISVSPSDIQIAKIGAEKIFADTGFKSKNWQKNYESAMSWYTVTGIDPTRSDAGLDSKGVYRSASSRTRVTGYNQKHAEYIARSKYGIDVTPRPTYAVSADKRPVWHADYGEDSRGLTAQAPKRTPVPVAEPTLRSKIDSVNRWITGQGPLGSEAKTTTQPSARQRNQATQPSARQRNQATQPSNQEAGKGFGGRDVFNSKTGRYDYFGAKKPGDKTSSVESQNKAGQAGSKPGYKMGGVSKFVAGGEILLRSKGIYDIYNDDKLTEAEKGEKVTEESIKLVRDQAINFAIDYGRYRFQNRAGGPANAGAPAGKIPKGGPGGKIPKGGPGGKIPKGGPGGKIPKGGPGGKIPKGGPGGKIPKGGPRGGAGGGAGGMSPLAKIGIVAGVPQTLTSLYDINKDYNKGLISKEDAQSEALKAAAWGALTMALPFIPVVGPIIGGILLAKGVWDMGYAVGGMIEEGIGLGDKLGAMYMSMQGEDENGNWETRLNERLLSDARSKPEYQEGRSARLIANQQSAAALRAERADRLAGIQVAEKENEILASRVPGAFRQERDWENRGEIKSVPDVNNFTYKQEKKLLDERKQRFLSVKRDVLDSPVDIPQTTSSEAGGQRMLTHRYTMGANELRHDPRLAAMYTPGSSPQSDNERLNQYLSMSKSDAAYFDAKIAILEKNKTEFNRIEANVADSRMTSAVRDRKDVNASYKETAILSMYRKLPLEDTVLKNRIIHVKRTDPSGAFLSDLSREDADEALLASVTDFPGDELVVDNSFSARLKRATTQEMQKHANENTFSTLGMGAFGAQIDRLTPHPQEEKEAKEQAKKTAQLSYAMERLRNNPSPNDPDLITSTSDEIINHVKKRGLWDQPIIDDWHERSSKPSGDSELARLSSEQRERAFMLMAEAVEARTGFAAPLDKYQHRKSDLGLDELNKEEKLQIENQKKNLGDSWVAGSTPENSFGIPTSDLRTIRAKSLDAEQENFTRFLKKDMNLTKSLFPGQLDENGIETPRTHASITQDYFNLSEDQRESIRQLTIEEKYRSGLDNQEESQRKDISQLYMQKVAEIMQTGSRQSWTVGESLPESLDGDMQPILRKLPSVDESPSETLERDRRKTRSYAEGFIPARSGKINNYARGYIPNFGMGSLPQGAPGQVEGISSAYKRLFQAQKGLEIFQEAQDWESGAKSGEDALKSAGLAATELAITYIPGTAGAVASRGKSIASQALDYSKGDLSGKEFALGAGLDAANLAGDLLLPPQYKLMKKTAEKGYAFGDYLGEKSGIHEGVSNKLASMLSNDKESRENIERLESKKMAADFKKERDAIKVLEKAGVLKDPYFGSVSFDWSAKTAPPKKQSDPWNSSISTTKKTRSYAEGFSPAFAQEKRAVLSSPSYAGHRDAVPMRSSVYKNAVINSSEIEVPASEVYSRMFGPAGANMKPKNPSETHAILNPAQQQSLGFSAGFIPNFSTEQFTAAITEAMKNGIASFAGGMVPNVSNSNTVNINDERSYQGNSDSMMDGVLDILQSKFPKEMGKMGPRIAKR